MQRRGWFDKAMQALKHRQLPPSLHHQPTRISILPTAHFSSMPITSVAQQRPRAGEFLASVAQCMFVEEAQADSSALIVPGNYSLRQDAHGACTSGGQSG